MGVRVLAVSDQVHDGLAAGMTAGRVADLILACGALPADYLAALTNALDAPFVFTPGNHAPDLPGYRQSRAGLFTLAGFPATPPWPDGALSADGRVVDAAGLRIAGLGGCLRYAEGPNQYTERQQARRARRLRACARRRRLRDHRAVDVLLTHAPPRGIGDADDLPHRGFCCYHNLVAELAPAALLHGHVHPGGTRPQAGRAGRAGRLNRLGWGVLWLQPVPERNGVPGGPALRPVN